MRTVLLQIPATYEYKVLSVQVLHTGETGGQIFIYSCSHIVRRIDFKEVIIQNTNIGISASPPKLSIWRRHCTGERFIFFCIYQDVDVNLDVSINSIYFELTYPSKSSSLFSSSCASSNVTLRFLLVCCLVSSCCCSLDTGDVSPEGGCSSSISRGLV